MLINRLAIDSGYGETCQVWSWVWNSGNKLCQVTYRPSLLELSFTSTIAATMEKIFSSNSGTMPTLWSYGGRTPIKSLRLGRIAFYEIIFTLQDLSETKKN
jgi:hypothetical protein